MCILISDNEFKYFILYNIWLILIHLYNKPINILQIILKHHVHTLKFLNNYNLIG